MAHRITVEVSGRLLHSVIPIMNKVLTGVQYYYMDYDVNNDLKLDQTELATSLQARQAKTVDWQERHAEMGLIWTEFYAAHDAEYNDMWAKADTDGDLESATLAELFDFMTKIAAFHHIHFLI